VTKKQNALYATVGLILGILGGVAGTSFSLGAERQFIADELARHQREITSVKTTQEAHEQAVSDEMDRYTIIASQQMIEWQDCIRQLTESVHRLREDVGILKALVERIEKNQDKKSNSN